jgi:hypothetical protein
MSTIVTIDYAASLTLLMSLYGKVSAGGIPNYDQYDNMPTIWMRKCGGQDYSNEVNLYKKLLTESFNRHGVCMEYFITSYNKDYDKVFGEDMNRSFIRKFDIMAWYKLPAENRSWTRFDIEGLDDIVVHISKDHFAAASTYSDQRVAGNIGRGTFPPHIPQVGDIIRAKYNDFLYEVVERKETAMLLHLNKHFCWSLTLSTYRDEHLSMSATTSASMDSIADFVDQPSSADIFNIKDIIVSANEDIKYDNKACEANPFKFD